LKLLMNPKSIAVVGASNDLMKMGTIQALSIVKDGYKVLFYPINRTEKTVLGHRLMHLLKICLKLPIWSFFIVPNKAIMALFGRFR